MDVVRIIKFAPCSPAQLKSLAELVEQTYGQSGGHTKGLNSKGSWIKFDKAAQAAAGGRMRLEQRPYHGNLIVFEGGHIRVSNAKREGGLILDNK